MNNREFLYGLVFGAGLMYLLDPDRGRRRRALIRDQVVHGIHGLEDVGEAAAARGRDLRNRAQGVMAEARGRLGREEVEDVVLEQRVRSELGRLVSTPGSILVTAEHGRVTLAGYAILSEVERLVEGVHDVRGVHDVIDRLEKREHPGEVPGLQGSGS